MEPRRTRPPQEPTRRRHWTSRSALLPCPAKVAQAAQKSPPAWTSSLCCCAGVQTSGRRTRMEGRLCTRPSTSGATGPSRRSSTGAPMRRRPTSEASPPSTRPPASATSPPAPRCWPRAPRPARARPTTARRCTSRPAPGTARRLSCCWRARLRLTPWTEGGRHRCRLLLGKVASTSANVCSMPGPLSSGFPEGARPCMRPLFSGRLQRCLC
mmetsp:Transcript_23057/g.74445  ORF Transcript_23057/g.74445 Transcript_23057/m.74445 type:complete len:212 (+) Transcript_23057:453-1088(+)